jgi:hypothetical protein
MLCGGDDVGLDEEFEILCLSLESGDIQELVQAHVLDVAKRPVDHCIPEAIRHDECGVGIEVACNAQMSVV